MPELIDRQAALEIAMCYCPDDDGCCSKAGHDLREMLDEIEALPIVHIDDMTFNIQNAIQAAKPSRTVEITFVRHGRWIPTEYDSFADGAPVWDKWECSECGHEHNGEEDTLTAFCPDCGTKLDVTDMNAGSKGGSENG
jgi:hypothetical protein